MARHVGRTTFAARVNIPFCIAAVLLFLTLISMHLTSGLFARYSTSVTDDDSARVAKFEVTNGDVAFSENLVLEFAPDSLPANEFFVKNSSEVSVRCTITVKNVTRNIPLEIAVYKKGSTADGFVLHEKEIVFQMDPNEEEASKYMIETRWGSAANPIDYMEMVDLFKINVVFEQVD